MEPELHRALRPYFGVPFKGSMRATIGVPERDFYGFRVLEFRVDVQGFGLVLGFFWFRGLSRVLGLYNVTKSKGYMWHLGFRRFGMLLVKIFKFQYCL